MAVNLPELLAPAGDMERLEFALTYGADAVYLAGNQFGMRAAAGNFDEEGLKRAVALAHARGVKVFLTCNAIPRNADLAHLPAFLEYAADVGVDAIITADIGVFSMVGRHAPRVERHISTQAGILNVESARAWHDMGASRVILARELSLEEIADIRAKTPRELAIEVFVHGAMCVSFSGRCLLSQYMKGRDANQGNCAQPCRWKFHLVEETRPGEYMEIIEDGGTHIMNAKDMSMIAHLPDLLATGVDSLKIEGRAKSFYYAAVVTNAYRKALDALGRGEPIDPVWIQEVDKVSHRHYTTGFFYDQEQATQHYDDASYLRGAPVIAVVDGARDDGLFEVSQRNRFAIGERLVLVTPEDQPVSFVCEEMWDERGGTVEVARHPMMKLRMRLPEHAVPYAIIRREEEDEI